ncbi:MAG: hypothetical protein JW850_11555 [Thermoflexales bacterium]|nr:hypothetical protein [Thermoflexales bacterium]
MNTTTANTGTRISPPPDFPVSWKNSQDVHYHWTRDREHQPDPTTPMYSTVTGLIAKRGHARTLPVYDEAVLERFDQPFNTYHYTRLIPFSGTPEEMEARIQSWREKVSAVAFRLGQAWENEWRPEIEAHWAFWAAFDLEGASTEALVAHLEESLARGARLYELHDLLSAPMWFTLDEFETLYCDLFPGATPLQAHRLLQGFDNKTLEIGRAMWRLRDLAKVSPTVCQVLTELPAGQVQAALEGFEQGRLFLAELQAFLDRYGRRSNLWDWGYPSWQDDPTPVINNIKNYLTQPERDLLAELAQAAAEREEAVANARRELEGYPRPVVERFEKLLKAAQVALVLTENHTYYMDFNGFGWIHRVIHQFGKRLAEKGLLHQPDEVFYLRLDELRQAATWLDQLCPAGQIDLGELAAGRRAEAERWSQHLEPSELGTRPSEALYLYSPMARRMLRYVGGLAAGSPPPSHEPGLLRGQAGSPGKVRGPARLIRSLAEVHRLRPGDILVTATTAPPWTPLFLTVAAVVTDAGGLLSHGAVVSREYRIPAVVGTHDATARVSDGQLIEVDGDNGVVYL